MHKAYLRTHGVYDAYRRRQKICVANVHPIQRALCSLDAWKTLKFKQHKSCVSQQYTQYGQQLYFAKFKRMKKIAR